MAAEVENQEQQAEPAAGLSKKMLFIIIGGVVGVIIIAVLLFFFMFAGNSADTSSPERGAVVTGPAAGNAYYVALPRPFIFNVPGQNRDRLVQISVQLMVRGGANDDLARQNIPMIEGVLHRTFSAATAESLQTSEGRLALRDAALNVVQNALQELTGSPVVEELLFTGFVMQ
ncbi:flagellar basal body-associated protein FliL [Aliidiomarina quisquiliarum]|uniref:flagellar basal body-associated protein FliL n=1 Tax=Aliidiomarina quisquiliarum TaxID=2938947 RepID=UPI00208F1A86|nr:flagellar basal body-associated protein FliL [Aliidiomarina quisquiliarum]MCO4322087.1 flagellar basal body-associated protein FliL [Aliidiomarina quisquiliarum]